MHTETSRMKCLASLAMAGGILIAPAFVQDDAADAAWLAEVLQLEEGMTVADIGAGTGVLSVAVAPYIGPEGHIYASELGAESVQSLTGALDSAGLTNVTVIEGHPDRTNLPEQCCEAIFIRAVYHHFGNPAAMNASLWRSLEPGGRLAIIDFTPRGSEAAHPSGRSDGDQHGVTATTIETELTQAGFTVLSAEQEPDRRVRVVAAKSQ